MAGSFDFALAIGGEAGQGIATPGNILTRLFIRRGLYFNAYNAYQSIVRGGHIFLTVRISDEPVYTHGDKLDLLLCLNQDTMNRHLGLMGEGTRAIFNSDSINPGNPRQGVELCPIPVSQVSGSRNRLVQNTIAVGATCALLQLDFTILEDSLKVRFARQGQSVVDENVGVARAGYEYAQQNFTPFPTALPETDQPKAQWAGNDAIAMGAAAAGVKFYAAYPMSPSTGVLHWMAQNARDLGIMVRQVEDEIGVANMVMGAAHAGARAMCSTSGGGFALMTEAVGAAAMMEIPVVLVDVQRAGPSTGVPTKTEQGDLWQTLGASQGDFPRIIVAPTSALDAYNTIPELFNLVDHYQCPGLVLSDLLISEGTFSVVPDDIDMNPAINRGKIITDAGTGNGYQRYKDTEDGISPRALPGTEGYVHVISTDEHDEDGGLISDEYTNPYKRRAMVEKRARKFNDLEGRVASPALVGPADADVTLIGWGSSEGAIREAVEQLAEEGITANRLQVKWIVPFHANAITAVVNAAKKPIIVENNYSGQFYRYLRSETGLTIDSHIRKYDGEPFMPHHIANGVREILAGKADVFVPYQEVNV
ncbi:MAG: 2-oxoacid:acceptor oxidoreductase subunit alpha [Chloroflexi bacterium]|nr:2-oxoacid:acceptor oxidoreductase subunit alpha [Chloroflexota bacterium]